MYNIIYVLNLYIVSIIVCTWSTFVVQLQSYVCKPQWNTSVHVYLNSYMCCIVHIHVGQEYCIVMEGALQLTLCMHIMICT